MTAPRRRNYLNLEPLTVNLNQSVFAGSVARLELLHGVPCAAKHRQEETEDARLSGPADVDGRADLSRDPHSICLDARGRSAR
jgi:hypothetical protein